MSDCIELPTENASMQLGRALVTQFLALQSKRLVVYLSGALGAGKTTLTRGMLRALDYQGAVKSPTYTLVEPYVLQSVRVYHFDLYRLGDPEELEFMGVRDYFDVPAEGESPALCIVEWPERGGRLLPEADIHLNLALSGTGRRAELKVGKGLGPEWQRWAHRQAE